MKNNNQRIEEAKRHHAILATRYKVESCRFDKTALFVHCTEKHFDLICKELRCSGIYREELRKGIITNFGYYN